MRFIAVLLVCWSTLAIAEPAAPVAVLTQRGAIGPANADYLQRGIAKAAAMDAQLVVIEMDTPGGLDLSMRSIIREILASPVPVATFVAPNGARAASAGTYILYASHIAAMAPATNLGAATPVSLGGGSEPSRPADRKTKGTAKDKETSESGMSTMMKKQLNDSAAYIRGLAQLRGRNADWAEKAVRESVSLSSQDALKMKVIDMIAADVPQLLKALDGRKVGVREHEVRLATRDAQIVGIEPDWRTRLLAVITDPSIAYLLLMIGFYGLLLEFYSPGMVAPGVIGGICLLLALFALQMLPVNYAGLALLALGVALMYAEHMAPGFGVLGIGGIVAFAIGSVMLIDTESPAYRIPWPLIAGVTLTSAVLLLFVLGFAMRSRRRPPATGAAQMLSESGVVLEVAGGAAYARVHGETWQVRAKTPLVRGQKVRVVGIDGLTLDVEGITQPENQHEP